MILRIVICIAAALPALAQTWVAGTGSLPALAVRGGTDLGGTPLYICRATDGQGLTHVGKYGSGLGCVYFYNGQAFSPSTYQVLTDYSADWQAASGGSAPGNSYQAASGPVYVCRALVENSRQVGQLRSGSPGCAIEFGGTGGVFTTYEVMWSPWTASSNGVIPGGAVQTGVDSGGALYTCRTSTGTNRQIGKLRADFNGCRIGLNGSISVLTTYEVLVGQQPAWQSYTSAVPAGGAFYAGSAGGQPKYICRFTIGGTSDLTPGQTGGPASESPNQCRVEYFGATKDSGNFEALVKNEPSPNCSYSVSPLTIDATAAGLTTIVNVGSTCGWVNFPSQPWLQVSARSGSGNGSFQVTVGANVVTSPRSATIAVGGKTITINQAASCVYSVAPTFATAPSSGVDRMFTITTAAGCPWAVTNAPFWISGLNSGTGNGTLTVRVAPQIFGAAPRTGTFTVGGRTVTVSQDGICPGYTVSPATVPPVSAAGAVLTFTPTAPTSCALVVIGPPWVTIEPIAPTGAFSVTIPPNTTYADRMGTINVGNTQAIDFTQFGQSCNVTATPATSQIPSAGGSFTIQVNVAHPSCQWSVSNNTLGFVSFAAGQLSGQGNGSITGTALASTQARSGSMQINSYRSSQSVTVSQAGGGCTYSATPAALNLSANLQGAAVNVSTSPGCPVNFTFGASWINFVGSVTGPGTYTLNVQENSTYATRTQTITIGSATVSASQTGRPCTPQLSVPATIPSTGASFQIAVQVPDPGCQWTATTTNPFLHLNSVSGTGNGSISGTADPNTAASARSGSVVVNSYLASATSLVNQAGQNCSYTLTPTNNTVAATGATRTFNVTTTSGCSWNAQVSDPSWMTLSGTSSGSGSGSFVVVVAPNTGTSTRTGSVSAGGITATILQQASTCSYTLSSSGTSVGAAGRSDSVTVTANAGCTWTASSPVSWVVITGGASGSGNGSVGFSVLANPGTSSRAATLTIAGRSFEITQAGTDIGQQTEGLTFVSLPPCRILETRQEYNFEGRTGVFGPPFLTRGETRTLPMNGSNVCPIPTSARAYVVNVTLVPRGSVDFVTLWAAGESRPNVWSIRSPDGNIVANSAIVKAGSGGAISLYVSDNTDVLIDVAGYYTNNTAVSNLVYYPLTPCRVVDTRIDYRLPGPFGPPSMATRETRRFRFPTSPCTVPQGASAYSMTITAVPQGALQFLTAWPAGGPQPNVSSINSPAGRVLANSVILPASADGSIDVFAFNQTDFIIDINGYFAPDDGVNGQFYFPITQCRASDSTVSGGIYTDNTVRTISIPTAAGCTGIPVSARGYALNVTALPSGSPMPFVTAYPTGQNRPNASILNAFEGQIVTNSAIIPAGAGGAIDVYAYRRTHLVVEVSGYFGR